MVRTSQQLRRNDNHVPHDQPHQHQPHIIVAEVDHDLRIAISESLRNAGYEVVECRHGMELVDHLSQFSDSGDPLVDLIIADAYMPGVNGLSVLEGLSQEFDAPPMVLITANGDLTTREAAQWLGPVEILSKPFSVDDLIARVREVIPPF